jgi:hypothetical protein
MIPFQLFFFPPVLIRRYPVRQWRDVTLWLKWGLLVALASVLLKVAMLESPAESSYIFSFLNYLSEQNDAISLTYLAKFGLFVLIEIFLVVLVWLLRAGLIVGAYQLLDVRTFNEGNFALSLAGASLITGVWMLLPGLAGTILTAVHTIALLTYLVSQVHRLSIVRSIMLSLLPGLVPFII